MLDVGLWHTNMSGRFKVSLAWRSSLSTTVQAELGHCVIVTVCQSNSDQDVTYIKQQVKTCGFA